MIFHEKSSLNFNSCNCYLLPSEDGITAIDPGCSRENLIRALEAAGANIQDIKNIVLTHGHSDHYGLVPYLKDVAGSQVYAHFFDRDILEDGSKYIDFLFDRELLRPRRKFQDLVAILDNFVTVHEGGISRQDVNPIIQMIFDVWKIYDLPIDHEFGDGDLLPAGLEVIHLPGHTPGHCAFLDCEHSTIFNGDIDFNNRGPVVSCPRAVISDFKSSIDKLINVIQQHQITRLLPGHWNPIFVNLEERLQGFEVEFTAKESQILQILANNDPKTLDEITAVTFRDFIEYFQDFVDEETQDSFLVGEAAELQTNLNYLLELERQEKVGKSTEDGQTVWFKKTS